MSVGC